MWNWLKYLFRPNCTLCQLVKQVQLAKQMNADKASETPSFFALVTYHTVIIWGHKSYPLNTLLILTTSHLPKEHERKLTTCDSIVAKSALSKLYRHTKIKLEEQNTAHEFYLCRPDTAHIKSQANPLTEIYELLYKHFPKAQYLEVHT